MNETLLHIYKKDSKPFQTLSLLSNEEAERMMRSLYVEGSTFWERFKNPREYLGFRKTIEEKIRKEFIRKGGKPKVKYPIYCILGKSKWLENGPDEFTLKTTAMIEIPFSLCKCEEVSFTYPDSMVSTLIENEKNMDYYDPDLHGKVFTYEEIKKVIEERGYPGYKWKTKMPEHFANYIEAQVWNYDTFSQYNN